MFAEQEKQNALIAHSVPVSFDEYAAHMEWKDGKTSLLSMTVYAKDEALADKMCKSFRKNTAKIYDTLIALLTDSGDDEA